MCPKSLNGLVICHPQESGANDRVDNGATIGLKSRAFAREAGLTFNRFQSQACGIDCGPRAECPPDRGHRYGVSRSLRRWSVVVAARRSFPGSMQHTDHNWRHPQLATPCPGNKGKDRRSPTTQRLEMNHEILETHEKESRHFVWFVVLRDFSKRFCQVRYEASRHPQKRTLEFVGC